MDKKSMETNQDSGYLTGPLTSCDLTPDPESTPETTATTTTQVCHQKTSSLTSSGYSSTYSRLDSLDSLKTIPESSSSPWQQFLETDNHHNNHIHLATLNRDKHTLTTILQQLPHPSLLNVTNDNQQSALHLSVLINEPEITRLLIVAGAKTDLRDKDGNTALHLSCCYGFLNCFQAISRPIKREEFINLKYEQLANCCQYDLFNYEGQTALHLAVVNSHIDIVRELVWLGVGVDLQDGKGGRTALHYSIERRDLDTLQLLLASNANPDLLTYGGRTCYQIAQINGVDGFCKILQDAGATTLDYFSSDESDEE